MALKRPITESTEPGAKRFGQVQEALEHKDESTTVLPDLSLNIWNLTMSIAVHEVTVLGGDKAPKTDKAGTPKRISAFDKGWIVRQIENPWTAPGLLLHPREQLPQQEAEFRLTFRKPDINLRRNR